MDHPWKKSIGYCPSGLVHRSLASQFITTGYTFQPVQFVYLSTCVAVVFQLDTPSSARYDGQAGAEVAQVVEHGTENAGVASSTLALGTLLRAKLSRIGLADVAQW